MIIANSSLKTLDNSGASLVGCIQVKKKYGRVAKIGSLIIVSIKKLRNNTNKKFVRKGNIFLAVLVQTKKKIIRKNNVGLSFFSNSVILVNKQLKPISTRVSGLVSKELKSKKFMKIVSMSVGMV